MKKILSFVFGFEVAAMIVALAVFKVIGNRTTAALIAGTCFVALGVVIVGLGLRDRQFRKTFTFWLGCIHLFLISLPMMGTRIFTMGSNFHDVMIMGLVPGPIFHRISEMFYVVLVMGTVFDRVRNRAEERQLGKR